MENIINVDNDKCIGCLSCVRICPVKAIKHNASTNKISINHDRCIKCGHCYSSCHVKAITYISSIQQVNDILNSNKKVAAVVDPTSAADFSDVKDFRKFSGMIKKIGFDYVIEASFIIDIVAKKHKEVIDNFNGKYKICSNCPAIVNYVRKFQPELSSNLVDVKSPVVASNSIVKKFYGDDVEVVYCGPCIGGKYEVTLDDSPFAYLTFEELRKMFDDNKITEENIEYSNFDAPHGNLGSYYPIAEGFVNIMGYSKSFVDKTVTTARGETDSINSITAFANYADDLKQNFNLFFCKGCINGPALTNNNLLAIKESNLLKYANKRIVSLDKKQWEKNVEDAMKIDLSTTFIEDNQNLAKPAEQDVFDVLRLLGKDKATHDYGCHICGFNSCYDFAEAVAKGLTSIDMCLAFTLQNKKKYIDILRSTNEKLTQTQLALKKSEKNANEKCQVADESIERTTSLLQKLPSGVILVDKNLKIVQSNNTFISMLGQDAEEINEIIPGLVNADLKSLLPYQFYNLFNFVFENDKDIISRDIKMEDKLLNVSIFPVKKGEIAGCIVRDMYLPEVQKEEVIKRVNEVISQNLQLTQEMGFLLGEGAATTEKMLSSIIESYKAVK